MGIIDNATAWMERTAADDSHGYSQANRWGPDYDCSSMVIEAWEQAGVPVKEHGATYTGNMYAAFLACGFTDETDYVSLNTGAGMKRGDVLLNHAAHTAMYLGNGRVVHARSSEGNSMPGDQNGQEIRVQGYWNFPWDCVLRYNGPSDGGSGGTEGDEWPEKALRDCTLRNGSIGADVTALQAMLNYYYGCAYLDIDSEFGPLTEAAVKRYQREAGMRDDGVCGRETWAALLNGGAANE